MSDDTLSELEGLLSKAEASLEQAGAAGQPPNPWTTAAGLPRYTPDMALLADLLRVPMSAGAEARTGRTAKAFDAWMAYELRRAGFHQDEVWPRAEQPRVLTKDLAALHRLVASLQARVDEAQEVLNEKAVKDLEKAQKAAAKDAKAAARSALPGVPMPLVPPVPPVKPNKAVPTKVQTAINALAKAIPSSGNANILGRFYVKQVDVGVSSWERGPDVLISGKTMMSSFGKNTKNRYEETLGEATNLRDRHPLAAMGYAFLVSEDVFSEKGAYARLQDLLLRTRRPDGPYDATMLLIADWDHATGHLAITDPLTNPKVMDQHPAVELDASRFFGDLLGAVVSNTPVGIHQQVRELRNGATPGGAPDPMADAAEVAAAEE